MSSFIKTLQLNNLYSWLPAIIFGFLICFLGFLLGFVVNRLFIKDSNFEAIFVLSIGLRKEN